MNSYRYAPLSRTRFRRPATGWDRNKSPSRAICQPKANEARTVQMSSADPPSPLRLTLVPRSQEALAMLADFGTLLINTDPVLSVARPIAPSLGLGAEPSPPVSQQVIR
jgi:hypothetical protein